jgi:hypothetical protein
MRISAIKKVLVANLNCVHYKFVLLDVAAKTMIKQELCQQCNQRQDCGQVYEQLGKIEGPSIVKKVVLALLLPLVVFVASLAIFERIFSSVLGAGQARSALSFASALSLTFVCILLTKVIDRQVGRDK